ncbi:MAG: thiolase domain-containing protein [Thermoproteus sp. AZ2]|uniref:Thiolase domain-containing protein n=1 Tax=Thermoproteus sp. AZ2 TaxID=1609232 RepID=A0ACC6UZ49_9CREN
MTKVAIVGLGWSGFSPEVVDMSFREMMFKAAQRAYEDAGGLDPRRDVDAFISCQEDFWEGISIADEFAPDPIGGAMKSVYTVAGDSLQCVGQAYAMIKSGLFDVVVVESHGKPSDILTLHDVMSMALDPISLRPLGLANIHALAALEARAYMAKYGVGPQHLAEVVEKAHRAGLRNPRASYAGRLNAGDYELSPVVVDPLREADIAKFVDAAVVVVLASEAAARDLSDTPVWVEGVGWRTETSTLELHDWAFPLHARMAAEDAYRQAKIADPAKEVGFAEVDNRYSFKELQHIEALGLAPRGSAAEMLLDGAFDPGGRLPVNLSGGALAEGVPLEVHGLARLTYAASVMRGDVKAEVDRAETAVVHSWRGVPTTTSAVAVLRR